MAPNTAIDIIKSETPSFALIRKELGQTDGTMLARAIMVLIINDLLDLLNITNTMHDHQVARTADMILEEYPNLRADDFKLCFKRGLKGRYGKVFNRFDVQIFFEWINAYLLEKEQEIEDYRQNENMRFKKDSDFEIGEGDQAVPMPDNIKELIKKKPAISITIKREDDPVQKVFNGFMRQFDVIHKLRPYKKVGGRFIQRYGKIINIEEYIAYKHLQIGLVDEYLAKREKRNRKTLKKVA